MDAPIPAVFHLSTDEKLQLVQDLWDDLAASPASVPIYDWQLTELERRRQNLLGNPGSAISWEDFDRQLGERYGG